MNQLLCISLLLLVAGCGPRTETTTFQVMTNDKTNQGTPFYAIVKSTDYSHFLVDDYQKIATQTVACEEDPTCLYLESFVPGETKTIKVQNKDNKPVAIYFIFTHPGEEWKFLADEKEAHKVKILLGENEIKSITTF